MKLSDYAKKIGITYKTGHVSENSPLLRGAGVGTFDA
jgi:hypothetical protein